MPSTPSSLLIITTDRLSAFDVVLPDPIPGKGAGAQPDLQLLVRAHAAHRAEPPARAAAGGRSCRDPEERRQAEGRSVIARRLRALPVEAVVRGYLIGSGWKDYQATGAVCGITLPPGLRLAERLPEPIFTPATKAAVRRARREHRLRRRSSSCSARRWPRSCARPPSRSTTSRPRTRARAASSSPTPSSSSDSTAQRRADPHRRGADAGLLALLAGRHLPGRHAARRPSTSSTCATTWRRSTGTSRRPGRTCRPRSSRAPAPSTTRRWSA